MIRIMNARVLNVLIRNTINRARIRFDLRLYAKIIEKYNLLHQVKI
jgi:hypothetical protein